MVAISFHRRSFQFTWPLRVLNFIIAVFIRFFVVSALSILLTPAFCDPRYNKLHAFHEVACFRDIPELLMGLISSVVLAFFVVAYTLSEVEHKIIPNALLTATTPHFNLALFITTIIFILETYVGIGF
ncbi:hypothetical protein HMI55_006211 [Coelomomyces lativittatus]|nr:hypothetical protein HMI55_006211 [Coelomomyces lativittatus]